jgi:hypothetical protein
MKWLTAFSCYAADAILVKPKGRLDINVEDKSHLVYDTKYSSKTAAARTAARTDARTTTRTATAALMRYVWHWVALGFNGSGGSH